METVVVWRNDRDMHACDNAPIIVWRVFVGVGLKPTPTMAILSREKHVLAG